MSTTSAARPSICWPSKFWLKWVAVFFGSLLVGGLIALMQPKPPQKIIPIIPITIHFQAYDTNANPLKGVEMVGLDGKTSSLDDTLFEMSKPPGQHQALKFYWKTAPGTVKEPDKTETVDVYWREAAEQKAWLEKLPDELKAKDSHYDPTRWGVIIKNLSDNLGLGTGKKNVTYPIVFRAAPKK